MAVPPWLPFCFHGVMRSLVGDFPPSSPSELKRFLAKKNLFPFVIVRNTPAFRLTHWAFGIHDGGQSSEMTVRTTQEITLLLERAMNERISFRSDRLTHCLEINNAKPHRDRE
jgi:hypothetical protein